MVRGGEIFVYINRKGDDSVTTRFEEEVMGNGLFQGQVIGEAVTKEFLGIWMKRKVRSMFSDRGS
jgi:hypothetical protein